MLLYFNNIGVLCVSLSGISERMELFPPTESKHQRACRESMIMLSKFENKDCVSSTAENMVLLVCTNIMTHCKLLTY